MTDDELEEAGYVHYEGDEDWWIPSGVDLYPADAASRFYMPTGSRDPYGIETVAEHDDYDLLLERTAVTQAPWQQQTSVNDYRTLTPVLTTDGNGNRSAIEIDALGLVVRSARMGKVGSADGDSLADPTARMDYVLDAWLNDRKPNSIRIRARERHGAANTGWRESWVYSNGSGGTAMIKAQAAPGPALAVEDDGSVSEVEADPAGSGPAAPSSTTRATRSPATTPTSASPMSTRERRPCASWGGRPASSTTRWAATSGPSRRTARSRARARPLGHAGLRRQRRRRGERLVRRPRQPRPRHRSRARRPRAARGLAGSETREHAGSGAGRSTRSRPPGVRRPRRRHAFGDADAR